MVGGMKSAEEVGEELKMMLRNGFFKTASGEIVPIEPASAEAMIADIDAGMKDSSAGTSHELDDGPN